MTHNYDLQLTELLTHSLIFKTMQIRTIADSIREFLIFFDILELRT